MPKIDTYIHLYHIYVQRSASKITVISCEIMQMVHRERERAGKGRVRGEL